LKGEDSTEIGGFREGYAEIGENMVYIVLILKNKNKN
jgi:hypothetical protein